MCVREGRGGGGGEKSISMFLQLRLIYLGDMGRKTVDGPLVDLMIGMSRLGKTMVKIRYD